MVFTKRLREGIRRGRIRCRIRICVAVHRSAEPNTLVIRMDVDQRDELIDAEPRTYYLTEHYVDYPCVLVRLASVREDALRDLLSMGWRFMSAAKKRGARKT